METTTLIIECPYDGNMITVYIKHQSKITPTKNLRQDDVVLFQNAYRKISSNIDIVCQLVIKDKNDHSLQVIGRIDRHTYNFAETPLKNINIIDLPNSAIIRNKVLLEVSIIDLNLVRIKYI
jgi:hypothetical protein